MSRSTVAAFVSVLLVVGCAVRLGGPKPVEHRTLGWVALPGAAPAEVASRIRGTMADVVLLAGPADSAWLAEVARHAALEPSGPGNAGSVGLAFLTAATLTDTLEGKPVGDTTVALPVGDDGHLVVHDALYRLGKGRWLDLMAVRIDPALDLRASVRALLQYVATDVMPDAAVILGIEVPDTAAGDSIAALLRPAFFDALDCRVRAGKPETQRPPVRMRLFYGPEVQIDCRDVEFLEDDGNPLLARFVIVR